MTEIKHPKNLIISKIDTIENHPTWINCIRQYPFQMRYVKEHGCCHFCKLKITHAGKFKFKNAKGTHYTLFCIKSGVFEMINIDHILPVSLGGGNLSSNYRLTCQTCNSRRSNNISKEEFEEILFNPELYLSDSCKQQIKFYNLLKEKGYVPESVFKFNVPSKQYVESLVERKDAIIPELISILQKV